QPRAGTVLMSREGHVVVVANETVAGRSLIEAIERRRKDGPVRVTVITPVNQPREGYVVYDDTRRGPAAGAPAQGIALGRDSGPGNGGRDRPCCGDARRARAARAAAGRDRRLDAPGAALGLAAPRRRRREPERPQRSC